MAMASSAEAARAWFDAVVAGDAEEAWRLTEPAYRRVFAQSWLSHSVWTREETVRRMSQEGLDDAVWSEFAELMRVEFAASWPREAQDSWRWMGRTPAVAQGCEYVRRADVSSVPTVEADDGTVSVAESMAVKAIDFYMRRASDGQWLLAGLNEFPPDWLELDPE